MGMVSAIALFWSNKPNPAINHLFVPLADDKKKNGGWLSESTSTINHHFGLGLLTGFFLTGKLPLLV